MNCVPISTCNKRLDMAEDADSARKYGRLIPEPANSINEQVGRIAREREALEPGSLRAQEIERAELQQSTGADFVDGIATTAAADGVRVVADEAGPLFDQMMEGRTNTGVLGAANRAVFGNVAVVSSLAGMRAGKADYNKSAEYEKLTEGLPLEMHDEIMDNDNLAAAYRARNRALQSMERGKRMMAQDSGALAQLAGFVVDVDLPLFLMSGGAFGSAKVARMSARVSKSRIIQGTALGANAGLQAGIAVGAAQAGWSETSGWEDIANVSIASMLLGGVAGGVLGGDVRASVRKTQNDFLNRVATDDPAYRTNVDVSAMRSDNIDNHAPMVVEGDALGPSTVGAAQVTQGLGVPRSPRSPEITPTNDAIITNAENWRHDSGWGDQKAADAEMLWTKVANHPVMNLTTGNFKALWSSKSAVLNYFAGNVFESTNGLGRGRATAAVRNEAYQKRIQRHIGKQHFTIASEWAKKNNATLKNSGYGVSQEGMRSFNREVMLELGDRRLGRNSSRGDEVKRMADQYELAGAEARVVGTGRTGETAIDGFDGLQPSRGYTPYRMNGSAIKRLIDNGVVTRDTLVADMANAYRAAGMAAGKDAEAVAKATVHRALARDADMDMSVMSLMSGDGKDFMHQSMVMSGMTDAQAKQVIDRLAGAQHNRSKESFAKSRNDIDFSASITTLDGSSLSMVDLFDQDLHGIWQRYTRQISGAGALARHGITNRAQRKEFIDAAIAEQRALGETPMERGLLEAMFSHFDAGPVHGYAAGATNEGIGYAALAKRVVNLSLLEKLGATQIAETGVIIAQNGLANWLQRGPMAILNKELAAGNKALLDDLAYFTGEIGNDQWHFAQWLDLDDMHRADASDFMYGVSKLTGAASFVQGYTSAFNHVRSFQQKTAVLGIADKVMREVKKAVDAGEDISPEKAQRFAVDLGIDAGTLRSLEGMVRSGTVEFKTVGSNTFVNRLHMDKWDVDVAETFAAALSRNLNQVVQKSLAGEQDAWMHTHVGSLVTHLKTFPLQAIQKQVMRNARFMDKQAVATVLYGLATAAVASMVRDTLDGKERTLGETAKQAFNYSNMTGFVPMIYDPIMSLIGMDDARINQFGPAYDFTPPVITAMNNMYRVPGALVDTLTGDADWYDSQALKAIPFAGTYVLSRAFD